MRRKLVCPINFGMVEENLYRSGQPSEVNFPFLSTLGLSAIIWLAVEEPQENFLAWADENDITIHHMGIQEGRDIWDPTLTEDCVVDALNVIVKVNEIGPLAIMCNLGRHRTGTVVGCLRRLQGWNLARHRPPKTVKLTVVLRKNTDDMPDTDGEVDPLCDNLY